jgi:hypothetical protein
VRAGLIFEGVPERIASAANLAPIPAAESTLSMAAARALQVGQKLGVFAALIESPATAEELARRIGTKPEPTRLLLDVLVPPGHLELDRSERYSVSKRSGKWLNPASKTYIGDFLLDSYEYWDWWSGLEALVRDGRSVEIHEKDPDDPYWGNYIRGQYQLARLTSNEVAKIVDLPPGATSLLDVAGAHGEFAMALCRRNEGLKATVVDLEGSIRVAREIAQEAGMSDRVRFVSGDMYEVDLGGPHDGALCFSIIHHLSPERSRELFARVREALRPGAPIAVLDLFDRERGEQPGSGSFLGLFFQLTSGATTYSTGEVGGWLRETGFGQVKTKSFRSRPDLTLLRAEAV